MRSCFVSLDRFLRLGSSCCEEVGMIEIYKLTSDKAVIA